MYEFDFLSCDGKTNVKAIEWHPDGPPKAILQISHGFAEHIARYGGFADFMASNGYIVAGHDHLTRGENATGQDCAGIFNELGGWETAVCDLRRVTDLIRERHRGLHVFLLGHSMGSLLARTYIIKYRTGLDGVLLSGVGQLPPLALAACETLAKIETSRRGGNCQSKRLNALVFGGKREKLGLSKTPFDWLTRDDEIISKYMSDPLCGRMPSIALFADIFSAMKYNSSQKNLKRMKKELPVFFFSGDMDPFGDYGKGVISVYRSFLSAGMRDVTMKLYHGGRHEMLNELNREEVYADVLKWIENKTGRT